MAEAAEAEVPDALRVVPLGYRLLNPRLPASTWPLAETIPTTLPAVTETLFDSMTVETPVADAAEAEVPDVSGAFNHPSSQKGF